MNKWVVFHEVKVIKAIIILLSMVVITPIRTTTPTKTNLLV
jgi:hypothetical protein